MPLILYAFVGGQALTIESDDDESRNPAESQPPQKVDLDPAAKDVDLNHYRLRQISGLDVLTQVEVLCLRWNFLKKIENLHTLITLRELELYDNQITKIENLDQLVNLESVKPSS